MAVTALDPVEVQVPAGRAIQVDKECRMDEIKAATESGFGEIMQAVGQYGLRLVGAPRSIYMESSPDRVRFTLAVPVEGPDVEGATGAVRTGELPGGRMLRFTHTGPYESLRDTYGRITGWLIEEGWIESEAGWSRFMPMYEEYVDDPDRTPPQELVTRIYLPLGV
jgi:effector-binding domain-containing protein